MSISGSLEDVSVADVMQFIHLGRRTGTLVLTRDEAQGMIGFHRGKLVSAHAPGRPKLGDLLVASGLIDRDDLGRAMEIQADETNRRSLGQILVSQGAVDPERLREVIVKQIEAGVSDLVVWDSGTFEFAVDNLRPVDDIALYPGDVIPDADINTQMVLLEAARIFDERNRGEHHELAFPVGGIPADSPVGSARSAGEDTAVGSQADLLLAGDRSGDGVTARRVDPAKVEELALAALSEAGPRGTGLRVEVVSADEPFAHRLAASAEERQIDVEPVSLERATGLREEPPVDPGIIEVVVADTRAGGIGPDQLKNLHRARPDAAIVALVEPGARVAGVYAAGALAALPPEIDVVLACVENLRHTHLPVRWSRVTGPAVRGGVERLRRVFGDLRSGLISATVALNLMHIISESVERAVLFLVKRDEMVALGAFGAGEGGRPLAELTRGIKLPLAEENALTRSLDEGEARSYEFEEAGLPPVFARLVGRPKTGQVVIFPVLGAQRVISIIYTDNGDREEPIEDIDILELATAQVGMAFENELLRRQISQQS